MYFLIGGDGREYGPFTADQIREWLAQGRANAHSRIRRDGDSAWQALRDVAEFSDAASLPPPSPGSTPPPLSADTLAAGYLEKATPVDIASCITRGWTLVRDNPGLTIGSTLLIILASLGLSALPVIGLVSFFISPVLLGGLTYVFTRRIRGEQPQVGDAFNGFTLAFMQLALGGVVSGLLISVGLLLCVLPGIYLAIGYTFALPLIIDRKYDFWTAMEVSRRVVQRQWWTIFGLALVLFVLNIIGLLACLVGFIVTAPLTVAAIQYAYEDIFGRP